MQGAGRVSALCFLRTDLQILNSAGRFFSSANFKIFFPKSRKNGTFSGDREKTPADEEIQCPQEAMKTAGSEHDVRCP